MTVGHRHVVVACFVALVAWGLAARWLPVLRYLAYAFTTGATAALILLSLTVISVSRARRAEADGNIASSPAFLKPLLWKSHRDNDHATKDYQPLQIHPDSFVVSAALDNIISLALRDFVTSWYKNISKSPLFANEVDRNIHYAILGIRQKILAGDVVNLFISKIVPIITSHLREFDAANRAVRGRVNRNNITESEELDLAIAAKYRDGQLHSAVSLAYSEPKSLQQDHLRKIVTLLLPDLLPETMTRSRAVTVLVKEIVACAVLYPAIQMLSDPDTWNQIIEAYGRTTLQDRKTVKRMRAALDEHTSQTSTKHVPVEIPKLAPNDSERAFERFVRAIRRTKTLADARRFRSQLSSQLARENLVEGQDPIYIRRLEMGKRVLEQKIAKMSHAEGRGNGNVSAQDVGVGRASKIRDLPLVEIMHTASGLSYFMEFMDRQNKMSFVQFWIVVDGFRNPLEDDFGDERSTATITWTDTDRLDIAQITESYITRPELNVPVEFQTSIQIFLQAGRAATAEQYRAARMAVLAAQSVVLEELESKYHPLFKKSDLYFKFLASDEIAAKVRQPNADADGARDTYSVQSRPPAQIPPMTRTSSQLAPTKSRDLRRAALSSSDVKSLAYVKSSDGIPSSRRSLDNDYKPLFDDDYESDVMAHSVQSLGQESANGDQGQQNDVIENMEAALTTIMTQTPQADLSDAEPDILLGSPSSEQNLDRIDSPRVSLDMARSDSGIFEKSKPSLATLGLVNTSSRIGVFDDNDLFGDEEKFLEDEYADHDDHGKKELNDEIHEAAPGDLGLTEAITALNNDIERLVSQESVVDTLTRKAELTNNLAELRILGKSKASLQREIRRKELQRQQYIIQESDNSLYGRATVRIKSIMVGKEEDGKEFALYVVEVQRFAGDQMPAATWAIARRYSEFHQLHQRLRRRYPSTRNLEFPRRRMVMKLQKQFLHNRRIALEAYLQHLISMPDVCRSRELRSFLSQQSITTSTETPNVSGSSDLVTRIYNSVTDGMDEFLGNMAVIDQLSLAGQNLISAASTQVGTATSPQGQPSEILSFEPGSIAEAEAELRAFEDKELEPFVKPICDIFLEIFELNRGNNWLRGRAVVVVLHQLLGGTVERKIRDTFKGFVAEDSLLKYMEMISETVWPGGSSMKQNVPRTAAQKSKSRTEAAAMLATLIPDLAGSVVGRANAQAAAKRMCATMNNARLNQHLAFCIFDEVISSLFDKPAIKKLGVG